MAENEAPVLAWDSCVVIDAVQACPKWWPEIEPMYKDAEAGKVHLLVSEVTVAEVCKGHAGTTPPAELLDQIDAFFRNTFIKRRPVDDRVSTLAGALIRNHGVNTCDALILATACIHKATAFYTRDGLKATGKKTKLLALNDKIHPHTLLITEPNAAAYLNAELWKESIQ